MNKVNRTLGDLEQKYEREPTAEEVAEVLEMTSVEVSDTIQMSSRHLSVDAPFSGNDENSLLDVLRDDGSYSEPDSPLIEESLRMEVDKVLSSLSEREAEVIRLYFGLVNERSMTLEEIGDRFKLTRERVRQIKEKSIRKLRHTSRSKNLRSYLG